MLSSPILIVSLILECGGVPLFYSSSPAGRKRRDEKSVLNSEEYVKTLRSSLSVLSICVPDRLNDVVCQVITYINQVVILVRN